ncbi:MAG: hypothetical protein RLZZ24_1782, partial [Pseudomonadota bacterium]
MQLNGRCVSPRGAGMRARQALHFTQQKTQMLGMHAVFAGGHKTPFGRALQ